MKKRRQYKLCTRLRKAGLTVDALNRQIYVPYDMCLTQQQTKDINEIKTIFGVQLIIN